jgi:signal transduction histidine kinase
LPDIKKEIDPKEVVKRLISRFEIFAEASNVKLEIVADPDLPKIFMDLSQLKLIVENLIDNAIRYSKRKGEVKIYLKRENKYYNLLAIQDKGMGIPKEEEKHIFQKFFRAQNANNHKTRGSGLGLYVVKSIVEKAGGKIWFKSKEGKGTTFFVTLPIKTK